MSWLATERELYYCVADDCLEKVCSFRRHCDTCISKKLFVILDLDETLFFADDDDSIPTNHTAPDFVNRYGHKVYKRPFCDIFLAHLFTRYYVGFWTRGGSSYATDMLSYLLKPDQVPEVVLHARHCVDELDPVTQTLITSHKPLAHILAHLPCNLLHIDDKSENFVFNPRHGILIKPFNMPHMQQGDYELLLKLALLQFHELEWHHHRVQDDIRELLS